MGESSTQKLERMHNTNMANDMPAYMSKPNVRLYEPPEKGETKKHERTEPKSFERKEKEGSKSKSKSKTKYKRGRK